MDKNQDIIKIKFELSNLLLELENKKSDILKYIEYIDVKILTIKTKLNQIELADKTNYPINKPVLDNKPKTQIQPNSIYKLSIMTNEYAYSGDEYSEDESDDSDNEIGIIRLAKSNQDLAKSLGIK